MRTLAAAVVASLCWLTASASAQTSATLDRYGPSEGPEDGFVLSGTHVPRHLSFALQLHLEYANDPLVYESTAGERDAELVSLVSDQLRAHLGVAFGLLDLMMVYAAMPVDLVLAGEPVGSQPTATGFGAGDLALGLRGTLLDRPAGSLALQARVLLPTGSNGENGRSGVAGESSVSGQPELTGELVFGPVHVLANFGMLFRQDFSSGTTKFSDELTFGTGGFVVLPPAERLQAHVELFGSTPLDDVGRQSSTAIELLLGLKARVAEHWYAGASGGFGLTRGYGSPDYRLASLLIWEQAPKKPLQAAEPEETEEDVPEEEPSTDEEPTEAAPAVVATVPLADPDRDGLGEDRDACPEEPGLAEHEGCAQHVRYEPDTGNLLLIDPIEFAPGTAEIDATTLSVVEELALSIRSDPKRRIRIESHVVKHRGLDEVALSVARVLALAAALRERDVAHTQLEAIACGASRPVYSGLSRRRGSNERVEARVVQPLPPAGMPSSLGCHPVALPAPTEAKPPQPTAVAPTPAPTKPAVAAAGTTAALLAALAAAPAGDRDGDTLTNSADRCPVAPGPTKATGCPATHDVDLKAGAFTFTEPLRFAKGGTRIRSQSASILPEVADTLRANAEFKVMVLVHTGSGQSADAALTLSQQRAAAVRQQLIEEHIDGARLQALGCGQNRPIAPTAVEWGDKKNERVELWLLDPTPASGVPSAEGCASSE